MNKKGFELGWHFIGLLILAVVLMLILIWVIKSLGGESTSLFEKFKNIVSFGK